MKKHIYLTKALNYWKRTNIATYLGIRALLDLETKKYNWLDSLINRKSVINKNIAINKYHLYKDKEKENFEYRECFCLSPFNALIESKVIEIINKYFDVYPSCVYSYLPTNRKSINFFRYFFSGYNKRNILINKLLINSPDLVINVFDLKKYYPSINQNQIINKITNLISRANDNEKTIVLNYLKNLYKNVPSGAPIGPAISCLIGTIALNEVDKNLKTKYKEYYFRYVDDIIIVSKKDQVIEIKEYVNFIFKEFNFDTNEKKYSVGNSSDWFKYINLYTDKSYNKLIIRLRLYLIRHQDQFDFVRKEFINAGFCFPFYKFKSDIKNAYYKNWLKVFIKNSKNWFNYRFDNIEKLINEAKAVRDNIFSELNNFMIVYTPHNNFQKRWFNQKINYFFNRLIYLFNYKYYSELYRVMEKHINDDKKCLLLSIINNDFSEIIKYPGQVVAILSSYLKEDNKSISISQLKINFNDKNCKSAIMYSLLILSCYGVLVDDINYLKENKLDLINLFVYNDKNQRIDKDFSFIDEISSLFLNKTIDDIQNYHKSYFSVDEDMFFETEYSNSYSYP